ncbi:class I SAM-dependent methyltransferase [Streptomyces blattellae]|uniref:class I SAM-dependent methyltransferase n=1 Tax=Streptomyces blattellae TaxID=2569855 RepID=UPI0012B8FC2F|nr:class I SAM-dependent methyltransferase [Streptomyces blattellae]
MTTAARRSCRLSAADWNLWTAAGPPTSVSPAETEHFQEAVAARTGMTAIDLACGTGAWTRQLADWGMTVTGYDFSDEALRQAETAGPCGRLSYALWDIVADPIPAELVPGTLDVVTCRYGLPYLEPGRLLTDVGRWLRPTGVFYALVRVGSEHGHNEAPEWQTDDSGPSDEAPLHLELTDAHLSDLGTGWARREVHQLSRCHRTLVLSGYGCTEPARAAIDTHRTGSSIPATRPIT